MTKRKRSFDDHDLIYAIENALDEYSSVVTPYLGYERDARIIEEKIRTALDVLRLPPNRRKKAIQEVIDEL